MAIPVPRKGQARFEERKCIAPVVIVAILLCPLYLTVAVLIFKNTGLYVPMSSSSCNMKSMKTLRNKEPPTFVAASPLHMTDALKDNAGQICLPCDFQGQDTGDTLYEFILETDNNNTLCCLPRDDNLQNLILELEENNRHILHSRRSMTPEKLRWWRERNHAAHLYASPFTNGPGISWHEHSCKTSFLRNLTLTENGRQLTVPQFAGAGTYFVYSVFTFDFSNAVTNIQAPTGVHNIYKHRSALINGDRQQLWTTKFGGENTPTRQTSFLCGVVNMNKMDTIETEAISSVAGEDSTTKHIDRSPYSNFFGMFKLVEFD